MSKQLRTLIIAAVAVLALVGMLLALLFLLPEKEVNESSDTTSSETTISLINKATDAAGATVSEPVTKAVVKTADESYVLSLNADKQLVVEAYADLPINTTNIKSLTGLLSKLSAGRKITDSAENAADYGLDAPKATVEVTYHDGSTATIELGNESPLADGYYLRIQGESAIYLVESTIGETLLQGSVMYIGTSVITAPTAKTDDAKGKAVLRDIKLTGTVRAAKPFAFRLRVDSDSSEMANFQYITTSPTVSGLDDNAASIITASTSLTATQAVKAHPTAEDLATYGLTDPYSVCEMSLAVETTTNDEAATTSYYNVAQHTIKLGGKDENGAYYALVDDYDVVYTVPATAVPWVESQLNDVVSKILFINNIVDVSSITVESGGKVSKFELTHFPDKTENDEKLTIKVGGTTYPTADFRTLYQVFMRVYRYGDADQQPTGDPEVTFTLQLTDTTKSAKVIRFYKQNASLYICAIEGGETYTVKASDVQKMLTEYNNYLNGKTVNQ